MCNGRANRATEKSARSAMRATGSSVRSRPAADGRVSPANCGDPMMSESGAVTRTEKDAAPVGELPIAESAAVPLVANQNAAASLEASKLRTGMLGYMLAHEQFTVPELVEIGADAADAGFDLLATSDHFQPWQTNEGHSGAAWVTMAALGARAGDAWMGTTVTCPTLRYSPGVVAAAFASLSALYPGRIFLGVGSGEALNEQAATGMWPDWEERWERLIEAIGIIRALWTGKRLSHRGKYYALDAQLYDPPSRPIPLLTAANGKKSMRLAGQHGDGLITDPLTWQNHRGMGSGHPTGRQGPLDDAGAGRAIRRGRQRQRCPAGGGAVALHPEGVRDLLRHSRPGRNPAARASGNSDRSDFAWLADRHRAGDSHQGDRPPVRQRRDDRQCPCRTERSETRDRFLSLAGDAGPEAPPRRRAPLRIGGRPVESVPIRALFPASFCFDLVIRGRLMRRALSAAIP
ncbi:MAG TPA: LLM class flavin-dependent oxidoreductase [Stellaceae bacterium]|nr:LLM class flavin-dependent oxidoreductase [Stellaceae bacterium]